MNFNMLPRLPCQSSGSTRKMEMHKQVTFALNSGSEQENSGVPGNSMCLDISDMLSSTKTQTIDSRGHSKERCCVDAEVSTTG